MSIYDEIYETAFNDELQKIAAEDEKKPIPHLGKTIGLVGGASLGHLLTRGKTKKIRFGDVIGKYRNPHKLHTSLIKVRGKNVEIPTGALLTGASGFVGGSLAERKR